MIIEESNTLARSSKLCPSRRRPLRSDL